MDAKRVELKLKLTKQTNYGGRACKPDSVERAIRKRTARSGDHSSRSRFAP